MIQEILENSNGIPQNIVTESFPNLRNDATIQGGERQILQANLNTTTSTKTYYNQALKD